MKRIHIALSVNELESSIIEYTKRLGAKPHCVVPHAYALWRTDQVNLSISVNAEEERSAICNRCSTNSSC